ncbi:MAG: 16S rRNA (guanine(527)-N(7))-methyltransferase RsmG [Spirochaetaceae bacterium]|nr:16S rRNA (guanine(527)-N(7))-methyltransferase RsmG [Spirochaetaceae bacterium]
MLSFNEANKLLVKAGLALPQETVQKLILHAEEVEKYGQLLGLTKASGRELWLKHTIDSLLALNFIDGLNPQTILDVGSGAGFPGLPLAITRPNIQFTLAERKQKRLSFLQGTIALLNIANTKLIDDIYNFNGKVDVITFRAFSPITLKLVDSLKPYCKQLVAYTGRLTTAGEQAQSLHKAGFTANTVPLITTNEERTLLWVNF